MCITSCFLGASLYAGIAMKNLIAALALAVFASSILAGDAPKAQAPAKPVAKAEVKACECKTVEVARKASLRERRNLVVVEKVPVVEVKKVEVKADCCATCAPAATSRRLLGGLRNRTVAVAECASCK
jgi:hypothetical protein